ncbi:hypothetical protein TthHB8_02890 [Thermus thermophilus]|nr:hypothetical protein JCM10941_02890 [Thermus thermophilus]BDE44646.1 hypothetical protein TthHB8_02890 [Thermus thermophilus]
MVTRPGVGEAFVGLGAWEQAESRAASARAERIKGFFMLPPYSPVVKSKTWVPVRLMRMKEVELGQVWML